MMFDGQPSLSLVSQYFPLSTIIQSIKKSGDVRCLFLQLRDEHENTYICIDFVLTIFR